jgi:hypothetical protein
MTLCGLTWDFLRGGLSIKAAALLSPQILKKIK